MKIYYSFIALTFFILTSVWNRSFSQSDSASFYLNESQKAVEKYNIELAEKNLTKAVAHNKNHQVDENLFYIQKGNIFIIKQEHDSAIFYLEKAEKGIDKIKDKDKYAYLLLQKGRTYNRNEASSKALHEFQQSHVIYEELKDSFHIGILKMNIGNVFKNIHENEDAILNYREAANIFIAIDSLEQVGSCYNNMGNVFRRGPHIDSAFYYMYRTLSYRKKSTNPIFKSYAYLNIANLHIQLNNLDSALYYTQKSVELKNSSNIDFQLYNDYINLGDIYYRKKDYKNSIKFYDKSLTIAQKTDDTLTYVYLFKHLGSAHYMAKNYCQSAKYYYDYVVLDDTLTARQNTKDLEKELIEYALVKDSIVTRQLMLQKSNAVMEKSNLELETKINKNRVWYLVSIIAVILIFGGLLYISIQRRLNESKNHQELLETQNEELKRTLISKEEKETLLKEIHHRVKNNLQIINSLIRLQSNFMTPGNFSQKLFDTENRIRSMALVHEKLYKGQNLSKLDADSYIRDLAENIIDSYESKTKIISKFEIDDMKFNIDALVPIGLIINEIISNSIKYAFTDFEEGVITIKLYIKNHKTHLEVFDNGIGADLTYEELSEDSLGMELIKSLTDQLDGTMDLNTDLGFHYHFIFTSLS